VFVAVSDSSGEVDDFSEDVVPSLLGKLTPVPEVPSDTLGVSELVEEDSAEVDEPLGASELEALFPSVGAGVGVATVDPLSLTVFVELSLLLLVLFSLLWLALAVSVALGLVGVSVTVCSEGAGVSDAVEVVSEVAFPLLPSEVAVDVSAVVLAFSEVVGVASEFSEVFPSS